MKQSYELWIPCRMWKEGLIILNRALHKKKLRFIWEKVVTKHLRLEILTHPRLGTSSRRTGTPNFFLIHGVERCLPFPSRRRKWLLLWSTCDESPIDQTSIRNTSLQAQVKDRQRYRPVWFQSGELVWGFNHIGKATETKFRAVSYGTYRTLLMKSRILILSRSQARTVLRMKTYHDPDN